MATSSDRARLSRALLLARELRRRNIWKPLPGPQSIAYASTADIIGFGGAAGGGKTDLACGKALTHHRKIGIFRVNGTELTGVLDRLTELVGSRDGYNGKDNIWRMVRHDGAPLQIELGSFPNLGDEKKYQGRPHDLLVFDEAANMREVQVRFLLGWLRTTTPGQRCQALLTFNPPTTAEGRWIIEFFAPWLDPKHPNPAMPGELRYFATIDGKDVEVVSGEPFEHKGETIRPLSRTFIPSRVSDNPYLMGTGYMATLQALPEPLRSQMLNGDFQAGMEDDPWQVIPTAWVEAAQARWVRPAKLLAMDSLGVDVARGGRDSTIIARRHGMWFDEPLAYAGSQTPDGPSVAGLVIAAGRDQAPVHIDVIGVGSSPYDFLHQASQQVLGINVAESAMGTDRSGRLRFKNLRSELWWRMREALDPTNNTGIVLPPSKQLLADLCAPTWELAGSLIQVESRDAIVKRIGRSPDYGSAYILALIDTPKRSQLPRAWQQGARKEYDPYA
ncbi:MAG: terminase [Proteobacteria bacterium]|nr:terminase [Pseudomonadota bacterium]